MFKSSAGTQTLEESETHSMTPAEKAFWEGYRQRKIHLVRRPRPKKPWVGAAIVFLVVYGLFWWGIAEALGRW